MNCPDFLTEFEERERLTEAAMLHLNNCPDCKKTSIEQTRVWQMIDVLPRVNAPNDFDFRVKARIANAKPTDFQPRFFPALRYVMPFAVIVLLLGIMAFNANYFSDNNAATQIAKTIPQTSVVKESMPFNASSTDQLAYGESKNRESVVELRAENTKQSTNQNVQYVAAKLPSSRQVKTPKLKGEKDSGGGDHLISIRNARVYLPKGLEKNQTNRSVSNPENPKTINEEQFLVFVGIETVLQSENRTVKSIKQNSLAERAGVEVGDVIEAIDGKKISVEPSSSRTIKGKTLTVLRGAKKIEIALSNP